jgi:hypothetical protein
LVSSCLILFYSKLPPSPAISGLPFPSFPIDSVTKFLSLCSPRVHFRIVAHSDVFIRGQILILRACYVLFFAIYKNMCHMSTILHYIIIYCIRLHLIYIYIHVSFHLIYIMDDNGILYYFLFHFNQVYVS